MAPNVMARKKDMFAAMRAFRRRTSQRPPARPLVPLQRAPNTMKILA